MKQRQPFNYTFLRQIRQTARQKLENVKQRFSHKHSVLKKHHTKQDISEFTKQPITFKIAVILSAIRSILLYLVAIACVGFALAVGLGAGYFSALLHKEAVPSYQTMSTKLSSTDSSASLYFAEDVKLGNLKTSLTKQPVNVEQMSSYLLDAIVATEDEDFYDHDGVMPKALIRAVISDITGIGSQTGGSTLTQQLVKMQLLTSQVTFKRKATEVLLAKRVDNHFSKKRILQDYLNAVTLGRNNKGQNIAGVQAAAQGLFGKDAKDLDLAESAYIAGLPQSPSFYTPYQADGTLKDKRYIQYGLDRKDTVLFRMYRAKYITKTEYQAAKKIDLIARFKTTETATTFEKPYGYVYNLLESQATAIMVKQLAKSDHISTKELTKNNNLYAQYQAQAEQLFSTKGYQIHSTIDKDIYDAMQETAQTYGSSFGQTYQEYVTDPTTGMTTLEEAPVQNGSSLVDNQSGKLIAFIGGRDFDLRETNYTLTKRSPGSALKPLLVYGPAIDNNLIGSQSLIADFPVDFDGYKPTEMNNLYYNKFIPAEKALIQSLNIPTVNLYQELLDKKIDVASYMTKMGYTIPKSDYEQLGLSLGGTSQGVSVWQQASAFSTFANGGQHADTYVIDKITDPSGNIVYQHKVKKTQVYSKATSYIVSDMLKGVLVNGTAAGVDQQLNFDASNTFGKSGTSNDYRDVWFVGSTPGVTLASWLGYDSTGRNLNEQSHYTNEAFWSTLMNKIDTIDPDLLQADKTTSRPSTVTKVKVNKETGLLPGTVNIRGDDLDLTNHLKTSLFNDWTPERAKEKFAIGATDKNYRSFWKYYQNLSSQYGIPTYAKTDKDDTTTTN